MNAVKEKKKKSGLDFRNFAGLMDIYEKNYFLIEQILPDLDELPNSLVSHVEGSLDLYLTVLERCKYTTTIMMTYYFPVSDDEKIADPDLTLKLYHDTGQLEALACMKTGFMPVEHSHLNKKPYVDCRWESNIFVGKWLRYSLEQGHIFSRDRLKHKSQLVDLEII
ncbi:MAG: DUF1249 domain-containing protein [Gammaproteobacteria bacterium]|nr:DUF1249 domain-containing protein [Gammaproteobacteria bacterium]